MKPVKRAGGFTLVEILVALAITAFIGTVAYSAFYVAVDSGDNNLAKARRINELDRAMSIIERDLSQAVARPVVTGHGITRSAFEGVAEIQYDSLDEYLLRFTRGGWQNPRRQHRSNLLRVGYRLFEGALWRDHWAHIDMANDRVLPARLQLLTDVESIRLRYLRIEQNPQGRQQARQRWREQWPDNITVGATGSALNATLPVAVEITFELEGWGETRRLFMLPSP